MRKSRAEDYFSFMSDKRRPPAARVPSPVAQEQPKPEDAGALAPKAGMEVIEGTASDTLIEQLFKRFKQP